VGPRAGLDNVENRNSGTTSTAVATTEVEVTLRLTASQNVLVSDTPLGPMARFSFSFLLPENCFALHLGAPSLTRGRVCNL
jgi:hypothetical protein